MIVGVSHTTIVIVACLIAVCVLLAVVSTIVCVILRKQNKRRERPSTQNPAVYFNNSYDANVSMNSSMFGAGSGAQAGPLPPKLAQPPAYSEAAPPSYASDITGQGQQSSRSTPGGAVNELPDSGYAMPSDLDTHQFSDVKSVTSNPPDYVSTIGR